MSVVSATAGVWEDSKHCSKDMFELVHAFIGQLAINLGIFEFIEALLEVLFIAHGCNRLVIILKKKRLITCVLNNLHPQCAFKALQDCSHEGRLQCYKGSNSECTS